MASASGLVLVPAGHRDPTVATTRGTGELMLAAIADGARRLIVGIGGSATNDGGAGLGQALGYRLLDEDGRELGPGGGELNRLARIDASGRRRELDGIAVAVACDVTNPLCGPRGASAVYGPQKGATPAMVEVLDANLAHFAAIVERDLGVSIRDLPGSGRRRRAGRRPGRLRRRPAGAGDQPRHRGGQPAGPPGGRRPLPDRRGCARRPERLRQDGRRRRPPGALSGCPVLALAGSIGPGAEATLDQGLDAYFSICPGPITLDEAIARAAELLEEATVQAMRAFLAGRTRDDPSREGPA